MAGRATRILIQLTGVVVLARVLTPFDFGIIAMVIAFIGIGELLRDFGLGSAAIQAPTLSNQQRDNLFWSNAALGLIVAVLTAATAPLIAAFYDEPRLVAVTLALAGMFLLNGLTAQYRANLARELRFTSLQLTDLVPSIVGLGTAISLGMLGFGYWALVAQQLVQAGAGLVLAAISGRWLPRFPRRVAGMRRFYSYGLNLFASQVLSYTTKNVDSIVIGNQFGASSLGLYNRAYELVVHPTNQIIMPTTNVAVSILSKLQDDADRFRAFLLAGQRALLYLVLPLMAIGGALAHPLVAIVLGKTWEATAPVVQILVVAAAFNACAYPLHWFALSRGETKLYFRVSLVTSPIWVVSVVVGSVWGVTGVAIGFVAGQFVYWLIALIWFKRSANAPSAQLFLNALRAIAANVVPTVVAWTCSNALQPAGPWAQIGVGIAAYLVIWCAVIIAVPALRHDVRDTVGTLKLIRR